MSQVSFTPLVPGAPENVNTLNNILSTLQGGINSVDDSQLAAGARNQFLQLATVGTRKIAVGTGTMPFASGSGPVTVTISHGMDVTPTFILGMYNYGLSSAVSLYWQNVTSTDITFRGVVTSPGTAPNTGFNWIAIG